MADARFLAITAEVSPLPDREVDADVVVRTDDAGPAAGRLDCHRIVRGSRRFRLYDDLWRGMPMLIRPPPDRAVLLPTGAATGGNSLLLCETSRNGREKNVLLLPEESGPR